MKRLFLFLGLTVMCLMVQSQTSENAISSNNNIVINQKMIDHFNSIEYSADQIDLTYILKNYSFNDAKDVIMAYRSGDIETTTVQSVEEYLSEIKKESIEPENPVYNKPDTQLLITQQQ
jgi:hypothetical protein